MTAPSPLCKFDLIVDLLLICLSRSTFVILLGHHILSVYLRQLLVNTCSFLVIVICGFPGFAAIELDRFFGELGREPHRLEC